MFTTGGIVEILYRGHILTPFRQYGFTVYAVRTSSR